MASLTLASNDNNDLYLPDGRNLSLLEDLAAVTHDVRLQTLQVNGENLYDVKDGVKYFEYIFSPQQSYDDARRSLTDAIRRSPDVVGIESLEIAINGNTFSFVAVVTTIYGTQTITNEATQ